MCTCVHVQGASSPRPVCQMRQGFWRVHLCCVLHLRASMQLLMSPRGVLARCCPHLTGLLARCCPKPRPHTEYTYVQGAFESTQKTRGVLIGSSEEGSHGVAALKGFVWAWGPACSGLPERQPADCALSLFMPHTCVHTISLPRRQFACVNPLWQCVSRRVGALLLAAFCVVRSDQPITARRSCDCSQLLAGVRLCALADRALLSPATPAALRLASCRPKQAV